MITPPVNSIGNFITVLRMLSVISNRCPDLAQLLLQQNIAFTLSYLLTGSLEVKTEDVELVSRSPQEWFEITCLIEELMPPLPTDGIFSVNSLLERTSNQQETVHWEWRDERHCCHPFSTIDSRIIEVIEPGRTLTAERATSRQLTSNTVEIQCARTCLSDGVSEWRRRDMPFHFRTNLHYRSDCDETN